MTSEPATTTHRGAQRLLRALGVAVVATVPAGVLHGTAHGHTPPLEAFALGIILTVALSAPLVGRPARTRRAARLRSGLAIGGGQALFHVLFSVVTTGFVPTVGHDHAMHDPTAIRAALAAGTPSALEQAHATWTPAMLAAHTLAAALTIGAVWYGERLLAGILAAGSQTLATLHRLVDLAFAAPARASRVRLVIPSTLGAPIALRVAATLPGRAPPAVA